MSLARPGTPSPSGADAMRDWNRAYETFSGYAAEYCWPHVTEVLETYRGPAGRAVYEIGFGSGMNLLWARQNGWRVGGCEVADFAFTSGRDLLPGADLRLESIVDCSASSGRYDIVVDR